MRARRVDESVKFTLVRGLVDTDAHHRRLFRRAGLTRWEIAEHRLDTRGQARLELGKLGRNPFLGRDPRWPQRERRIPTQSVDLLTKSLRGVEGCGLARGRADGIVAGREPADQVAAVAIGRRAARLNGAAIAEGHRVSPGADRGSAEGRTVFVQHCSADRAEPRQLQPEVAVFASRQAPWTPRRADAPLAMQDRREAGLGGADGVPPGNQIRECEPSLLVAGRRQPSARQHLPVEGDFDAGERLAGSQAGNGSGD